jgi:hypothetical protein
MVDKIQVQGLREFQKALKDMDAGLPKMMRLVFNEAAGVVVDYAKPRIPNVTGRARASVKLRSTQRAVRIAVGGSKAPWFPWLDFGGQGRVKGRPVHRPFLKEGRYIYAGLRVKRDEVTQIMSTGLTELAKTAGLEVS